MRASGPTVLVKNTFGDYISLISRNISNEAAPTEFILPDLYLNSKFAIRNSKSYFTLSGFLIQYSIYLPHGACTYKIDLFPL